VHGHAHYVDDSREGVRGLLEGDQVHNAEIFPNEGLDLIYAGYPKGATGPANTWLGLFTAFSATTVGTSVAVVASWTEVASAGAYARQTISSASWGTVGTTQSGRGSAAAQVTYPTATAVWGTVNGFIVTNSLTVAAGVVWFGANFDDTTAVVINTNDVIKVTPTWVFTG
jgi:hypothetical protein